MSICKAREGTDVAHCFCSFKIGPIKQAKHGQRRNCFLVPQYTDGGIRIPNIQVAVCCWCGEEQT